jgi:hypothetical protein
VNQERERMNKFKIKMNESSKEVEMTLFRRNLDRRNLILMKMLRSHT